jgi:sulfite reductase (NADPH) hemoprotein beta-component
MYEYDQYDQRIVDERVAQFRDQTRRFLAGELTNEEFLPLRLQNGLYMQLHAHMLRVAIPYGLLSARKVRKLAYIARTYDKGYAHFTTRQNVQYNWPKLEDVPDILAELASVQMHAIQTSGNCIRNVTSDQLAGAAADEIADPRPYCEIIRQWSTFHPEFAYLPRKFKIACTGATTDRAAVAFHDIGLALSRDGDGVLGFRVLVGGGMGRTPYVGAWIREFLPEADLLTYLEAIVRVYNRFGRRDNKYKARIKILVASLTPTRFATMVEEEWTRIRDSGLQLVPAEVARVARYFAPPSLPECPDPAAAEAALAVQAAAQPAFADWLRRNAVAHKLPGFRSVYCSLKHPKVPPGDVTADQLDGIAALADQYSCGEIRSTHNQNLLYPHVPVTALPDLWRELAALGLATPNMGLLTDIICCPGLDFCSLANATSIPIAAQINERFDRLDYLHDLGELEIKMSGCMNACGHHHVGHIGILGVDKRGRECYQLTLGGSAGNDATLGDRLGPAIEKARVAEVIEALLGVYLAHRVAGERFLDTYRRIGLAPFRERVYGQAGSALEEEEEEAVASH